MEEDLLFRLRLLRRLRYLSIFHNFTRIIAKCRIQTRDYYLGSLLPVRHKWVNKSHLTKFSIMKTFFLLSKKVWIKNWMRTIAADYLFPNNFVVFTCSVQGKNFEIMRQEELCIKLKWFFKYYICIISESILFVEAHSRAWPKIYKNNKSELGVRFSFCATAPPAQCA